MSATFSSALNERLSVLPILVKNLKALVDGKPPPHVVALRMEEEESESDH